MTATSTKPSVSWYWIAGLITIVGMIGAAVSGLTAYSSIGDRMDGLARTSLPGRLRAAVVTMTPRPVLLIVGRDALGDEVTAGPRLRAAAPATVNLWEVPGAGHTGGLTTQPQQWETHVVGFLEHALR